MSWNKNAFSYLTWLLYSFMAGVILIAVGAELCAEAGLAAYWGIALAVLYGIIVCAAVFKLRGLALKPFSAEKRGIAVLFEAILVTALLSAGLFFRVQGMGNAELSSEYYEAAKVVTGQRIPQVVHGASYLYIKLLHEVFVLLGNHIVNGIWVQIILQMTAFLLLFFVMRKLAGEITAVVTFSFFMCAPYMIRNSLVLSPGMLYFLIFMIGVFLITGRFERKPEPALFFLAGILAAFCCYLDITGALLLVFAVGTIFCRRKEEVEKGRKLASLFLCLTGAGVGFPVFLFLDAMLSGKAFHGVAGAWFALYAPEGFRLPVTFGPAGMSPEVWVLAGALTFGIFSFWCHRQEERISSGVTALYFVMAAGCFGIFAEEQQSFFFTYVLLVLLAGVGVAQCLRPENASEALEGAAVQNGLEDNLVIEELGDSETEISPTEETELRQDLPVETEDAVFQREKALKEELKRENENTVHKVHFLENPLPVPKKHVKRVMDYPLRSAPEDDFDFTVAEEDDFDI